MLLRINSLIGLMGLINIMKKKQDRNEDQESFI